MPKQYHKIFSAKEAYLCFNCNCRHEAGTRTLYNEQNKLVAADCFFQKKGYANPKNQIGAGTTTAPDADPAGGNSPSRAINPQPPPAPLFKEGVPIAEIRATTESNLDFAVAIVRSKFDISKDAPLTEAQLNLVSELCHEQHALIYLAKDQARRGWK